MENNIKEQFSSVTYVKNPTTSDYLYVKDWVEGNLRVLATNKNRGYNKAREGVDILHFKKAYTDHKRQLKVLKFMSAFNEMTHEQKLVHNRNKRYYQKKKQ